MRNVNGMSESAHLSTAAPIPDPRFIFISKQRYMQLIQDVGEVFDKIDYAFIKGEALSLQAYGKPGARISSDIDILTPRDSLRIIEIALVSKGYDTNLSPSEQRNARILCLSSSHQLMPYRKRGLIRLR
jgi:hypothetical protein